MSESSLWPTMLFRQADDGEVMHGVPCETMLVNSADEMIAAEGIGWHRSPTLAGGAVPDYLEQALDVAPVAVEIEGVIAKRRGRPPKPRGDSGDYPEITSDQMARGVVKLPGDEM